MAGKSLPATRAVETTRSCKNGALFPPGEQFLQAVRQFSRAKAPQADRAAYQAAETDRAAVASSSNAVEMSRILMTPIRL